MPKLLLIDVIHINAFVPSRIPDTHANMVNRTLHRSKFTADLRRAVRGVFRGYPSLNRVKFRLSR
jgi:hypothetical protein